MAFLVNIGGFLYGLGIVALGVHQLIIGDFRQEILPPVPAWLHQYLVFPIVTGLALIAAGVSISGLVKIKEVIKEKICLYLGFGFLVTIVVFHLPYNLLLSPESPWQLQIWFPACQALAYGGGAFVMAGSFSVSSGGLNAFELLLEKLIPSGRIFFSILMFVFGCSHFVYAAFVSTMVPEWAGFRMFWTYFVGVMLLGAAVGIIFKIWLKPIAFLLAVMLFLFFVFFHVPDAMGNPREGGGMEIVRAVIALLFCGIALVIVTSDAKK